MPNATTNERHFRKRTRQLGDGVEHRRKLDFHDHDAADERCEVCQFLHDLCYCSTLRRISYFEHLSVVRSGQNEGCRSGTAGRSASLSLAMATIFGKDPNIR